ncbi:MAG TPA: TrmH family RNA methyltransferase [Candidatus Saccharimonadales bacterium]|nr:TrmH family RNA methyltransferase [Candidatus Saccharimonadales bacterium]
MRREIIVIAHNIRSAHNVGSLIRTCEGMGVEKLFLSGYTPYPPINGDQRLPHIIKRLQKQIDKTALGAQDYLSWQHESDVEKIFRQLRDRGYSICALEQSSKSRDIRKFKPPDKIALIAGNELSGLEEAILDEADCILEIPMFGKKESFNVVQACAMALFRLRI